MLIGPTLPPPSTRDVRQEAPAVEAPKPKPGFGLVDFVNRKLGLDKSERGPIDDIVARHERRIVEFRDAKLPFSAKRSKIRLEVSSMASEIGPMLTPGQRHRRDKYMDDLIGFSLPRRDLVISHLAITYADFMPSGPTARSIFGDNQPSYGISFLGGEGATGDVSEFGFSFDEIVLYNDGNDLFMLSPQITYTWSERLARHWSLFEDLSAGPAYMDYSFDLPSGQHRAAKRLGGDAMAGIGLRYDRLLFTAGYRQMTEPAAINFSGLELALTWTVVRF